MTGSTKLTHTILASAISMVMLASCGNQTAETEVLPTAADITLSNAVSPGIPGTDPTWAFSGKTGIGTSYEPYIEGRYKDTAANPISRVWFSLAQGVVTETMFGLIHNAQLKEMQFVITGNGFVDTEKEDTDHSIEYLHTDEQGRPLSLAYKLVNKDRDGKYQIEKHIFTDPDRNSLMMKVIFTAFESGVTPHLYVNPHIDNSGANDIARYDSASKQFSVTTSEVNANVMTVKSSLEFEHASVGFVGTSDGLTDLKQNGEMNWYYTDSSNTNQGGNVALTAQYPSPMIELDQQSASISFDVVLGFGKDKLISVANANDTLALGSDKVLAAFNGEDERLGWEDYLNALPALTKMAKTTTDNGKLLFASALVLKAQEDKTHAGALIASLSNPWGDTVSAKVGSTGYKAVWPRDFYQCAMAFLAMGDTQTPKTAFEYLEKVQVSAQTPGYSGTPGWFLQKTHVDGQIEWVGVQLDQTAMPIMLGWKLWQAGVLSDSEISHWYHKMLKPAADFLVSGGEVNLDWNHTNITPLKTQQERWEEQQGYSPSTTAAVISGLITASDIAAHVGDTKAANLYLNTAKKMKNRMAKLMVTTSGLLSVKAENSTQPYFIRLAPNGTPNSHTKLGDNNGRAGVDQRLILDAGFLELVRYGVTAADDQIIANSVDLVDSTDLEDNLRVKYQFSAKDGSLIPGFRRYGNDGYGEDQISGDSYAEKGQNTPGQRGRVWPFFTGERGHFELAKALKTNTLNNDTHKALINTYVQGMETFANQGLMLPEQAWDGVGNSTRYQYTKGQGTNSATPLAWTHAEYIKLVRSMSDKQVWDNYSVVAEKLAN
ncbi:glucan 1,4-alpha-glucosidase [Shewanella sp. KX20019]|uniref:glycoside hydrolase family 15 protein n=1 Tax=Shewanella sp. KX20019 TaxID=2803864 RepID=UPI001925BC6E|nr:glycoside hydrolase family 15 protein [Shewanella sp. KX20019]QQX82283.1 glucan 1,4-alpha-glucosidase [Shewanella sp. KX20019]